MNIKPLFILVLILSNLFAYRPDNQLGTRQTIALWHILTSLFSSILIVYLAIQFRMKQKKFHKEIAYIMAITGLASLYFSWQYGFVISLNADIRNIHYITGFLALILSLLPILIKPGGKMKLHCRIATAAAVFAIVSIITGIIGYQDMIINILSRLM
ncbi:MAG: hypothetical protein QXE90_02305 [Candidatus Micrarchaeia archaeon]